MVDVGEPFFFFFFFFFFFLGLLSVNTLEQWGVDEGDIARLFSLT